MKYYLIYFLNYKDNDAITLKDSYQCRDDALKNVERNAIEYIKELQGKQQADICKQEKTPEKILSDTSLKERLYIRKENECIILYEKLTVVIPGTVWNSSSLKIKKIGKFYITEYNFDDSIFRCTCMLTQKSVPKFVKPETKLSFVDELVNLGGKFNLKPVNKKSGMTTKASFNELCQDITNF